jgi:hypothetical protein
MEKLPVCASRGSTSESLEPKIGSAPRSLASAAGTWGDNSHFQPLN